MLAESDDGTSEDWNIVESELDGSLLLSGIIEEGDVCISGEVDGMELEEIIEFVIAEEGSVLGEDSVDWDAG